VAVSLRINGLDELRAALKALPDDLLNEATVIVNFQAEAAAREITAAYPLGKTGNLKYFVRVEHAADAVSATAKVRNRAKHAWLFEYGTAIRSAGGKNRGRMPAGRVFVPIAMQRRRIMLSALIDLVRRAGLHVSGAAG
jgi:hypothetical protein